MRRKECYMQRGQTDTKEEKDGWLGVKATAVLQLQVRVARSQHRSVESTETNRQVDTLWQIRSKDRSYQNSDLQHNYNLWHSCRRPTLGTTASKGKKEMVMVRQTSLPLAPDWSSPKPHPTLLCPVWILSSIRAIEFWKGRKREEKVLTTHPARLICRKPTLNFVHLLGRKSEWRLPTRHTFPRQGREMLNLNLAYIRKSQLDRTNQSLS